MEVFTLRSMMLMFLGVGMVFSCSGGDKKKEETLYNDVEELKGNPVGTGTVDAEDVPSMNETALGTIDHNAPTESPTEYGQNNQLTQDNALLGTLYRWIRKTRRDKGIKTTIFYRGIQNVVESYGFVTSHPDHAGDANELRKWGRPYGLRPTSAIIACASSTGCMEKYSNWSKKTPGRIWYEYRDITGHYDAIIDPKNKYAGCSAMRRYRNGAYQWSVWCRFMTDS